MRRRTTLHLAPLAAAAAATAVVALPAPAAHASDTWCDVDPIQLVITAGGRIVPIFVTNGAPSLLYAPQLLLARISHTAEPVPGGTLVTVRVTVPNGLFGKSFPTRSVVTSGPLGLLRVYASATGVSGSAMTMRFTLPVA